MTTAKQYILEALGFRDADALKTELERRAVNQYGALNAEIKRPDLGFSVYFTSNPNHFCRYGARLRGVGMTNSRAIDADSITEAGLQRGCTQTLDDVIMKTTKQ